MRTGRPKKGRDLLPAKQQERIEVGLHPGQWQAMESQARVVAVIAGTGSGKTYLGPRWLYKQIVAHPEGHFLVVAPVSKTLYRATLPALREFLERDLQLGVWMKSEETFRLHTGGKIYMGTATEPQRLEGIHCHGVWLDEPGQMKQDIFAIALRRTGFHQAPILLTTTPYGWNWLKTEVWDKWKAGEPGYEVVNFPSWWNPSYPLAELERARRDLPAWQFRMFYLGEFERPIGLVYEDFNPKEHLVDPLTIPQGWLRLGGVDFGYQQPTACAWIALGPGGQFYVYRVYKRRGLVDEENARNIAGLSSGEKMTMLYADAENPGGIAIYRAAGLPVLGIKPPVLESINQVITLIRNKRLFCFKGLAPFEAEMGSYFWAEKEGIEKPAKGNDHLMDAMRYALIGGLQYLSPPIDAGPAEPSPWLRTPEAFSVDDASGDDEPRSAWLRLSPRGAWRQ